MKTLTFFGAALATASLVAGRGVQYGAVLGPRHILPDVRPAADVLGRRRLDYEAEDRRARWVAWKRQTLTDPPNIAEGTLTVEEGCTAFVTPACGDTCMSVISGSGVDGLTLDEFFAMNPAIDNPLCHFMLAGEAYCVDSVDPAALATGSDASTAEAAATSVAPVADVALSPTTTTDAPMSSPTDDGGVCEADDPTDATDGTSDTTDGTSDTTNDNEGDCDED